MNVFQKIKAYLVPEITPQVQAEIDRETMRNLYRISLFVLVFEVLALIAFVSTRAQFDHAAVVSLRSVAFCILTCLAGILVSKWMLSGETMPRRFVVRFKIIYFAAFSVWAIFADYRQYIEGKQMLTFFAVELLMVCFVLFRPWISILLMGGAYLGLYVVMFACDGAAKVQVFNYMIFALVSIVGMMVRFHVQADIAAKSIRLMESNRLLEYANRHDGLTGLRNRRALDEDADLLLGKRVAAYMVDINYFKEVNDQFGHGTGDTILREAGRKLKELYPGSLCYRYGGDEFLVLSEKPEEESFRGDVYRLEWEEDGKSVQVNLCIGSAEGTPRSREELFALISGADAALYDVKKRTHSPEFGGHDRRRR